MCPSGSSGPCRVDFGCRSGGGILKVIEGPGIFVEADTVIRKNFDGLYYSTFEEAKVGRIEIKTIADSVIVSRKIVSLTEPFPLINYNFTGVPFVTHENGVGIPLRNYPELEGLIYFIPFDPEIEVTPEAMIDFYYCECCGSCGIYGECDWFSGANGCSQCKCRSSSGTTGCTSRCWKNGAPMNSGILIAIPRGSRIVSN